MHQYKRDYEANSWAEFKAVISKIEGEHLSLKAARGGKYSAYFSTPLYRGHGDASWTLATTLEREIGNSIGMVRYFLSFVVPAHDCLSGIQGEQWPFDEKADYKVNSLRNGLPNYAFLCYLRHHGFPSPLLDWSRSIYVAAFFAFQMRRSPEGKVAVYWFQETLGQAHGYDEDKPCIKRLGRWTQGHKRHFLQQSEYTLSFKSFGEEAMIVSTEDAVEASSRRLEDQDRLYKITMPQTMRVEALRELNAMNINAYSVYQTEDGLVESIGWKLFNEED